MANLCVMLRVCLVSVIFRVYCADHTFCTLKFPLSATAAAVRRSAADKLGLSNDDLMLVQLKSSGEFSSNRPLSSSSADLSHITW